MSYRDNYWEICMKNFLIATNYIKDSNLVLTTLIEDYLKERGCSYKRVLGNFNNSEADNDVSFSICENDSYDCAIALGGDGTILQVSRDLRNTDIPIVGVNLGTIGFLTEVEPNQIEAVLDRLIDDDYSIEERMNIEGCVVKGGKSQGDDIALNDIVITRAGFSRVIGLKVYVNGKVMEIYEADGVIVSTPTGSTGYNLSAGGPIVSPKTDIIIITPISSHSLTSKSIVLSGSDEIEIEVLKMRKAQKEEAILSFDGQPGTQLSPGDRVKIVRSDKTTKMIKLFDVSFYKVLRDKIR